MTLIKGAINPIWDQRIQTKQVLGHLTSDRARIPREANFKAQKLNLELSLLKEDIAQFVKHHVLKNHLCVPAAV